MNGREPSIGVVWRVVRIVGTGLFGYVVPRILQAAGVPLDDWARAIGTLINGSAVAISAETAATVLGLVLAAILMTVELWWKPIGRIVQRIGRAEVTENGRLVGEEELIPLPDAARFLYENAREKAVIWARAAEGLSGSRNGQITIGSSDDILNWIATYMSRKAQIYGSRPPSARRERIQDTSGHFESGALIYKTDRHVYTDLAMDRGDMQRLLSVLIDQHRD